MRLTKIAVNRPVSILLLIIALVVFGFTTIFGFDLGYMPEMNMPMLGVITMYNGASPDVVEELVTSPIEDVGMTIEGYTTGSSYSYESQSIVIYQFEYGTDVDNIYMDVKTALDKLDLPDDTMDPFIIEAAMDDEAVLKIILNGKDSSGVLDFANDKIVPELENLSDVSSVDVSGGSEYYISVLLDKTKMDDYGVSISSIKSDIDSINFTIPANSIDQGTQTVNLSTASSIENIQELVKVKISTATGSQILLTDVAEISYNKQDPTSISRYNGNENVSLDIIADQGESPVTVARHAKEVLEQIEKDYPDYNIQIEHDDSDEILSSLFAVGQTLLLGIFLSMLVLYLFFGDIKASLIVGSSMPVSLLITIVIMGLLDFELNLMTSTSLLIAIGMMVDNSIVVIDSCFNAKNEGMTFKEAAIKGSEAVGLSVVASTITTVVVYLPISIMDGFMGQMFKHLGYTIMLAMSSSLLVAIVLIPLCFYEFMPIERETAPMTKGLKWLAGVYRKYIPRMLNKKLLVVGTAVGLLIGSFFLVTQIPLSFMPGFGTGVVKISAEFRPGTKIEVMDEMIQDIENDVSTDSDVENYSVNITSEGAMINVYLFDKAKITEDEYAQRANEKYSSMVGMDVEAEVGSDSPFESSDAKISMILESTNYDDLMIAIEDMKGFASEIEAVTKVSYASEETRTRAEIEVDNTKAAYYGISPVAVAGMVRGLNNQEEVLTFEDASSDISVMLEYEEGTYSNFNDIMQMEVPTNTGMMVALNEIAELKYTDEKQTITKSEGRYSETLEIWADKKESKVIQEKLDEYMETSPAYKGISQGESFEQQMMGSEFPKLISAILTAVFLVFLVMGIQFESPKLSLMVMLSVVFSLVGSFGLMFISGEELSTIGMMGVLMLVGIVVNNGILFVDTANQLVVNMPIEQAVVESGSIRLRPILMTTMTTVLSMVPLSIGLGAEDLKSMGIIIIGGLLASTLLILILLPTFYLMIMSKTHKRRERKEHKKRHREKKHKEIREIEAGNKNKEIKLIEDVKKDQEINNDEKETKVGTVEKKGLQLKLIEYRKKRNEKKLEKMKKKKESDLTLDKE